MIKKLKPQDPGGRRWTAQFGDKLVCVRCRVDAESQRRQTTEEPVADEAPTLGSVRVGLRIAWAEEELRQRVKESGGKWNLQAGVWRLPLGEARRLGLTERVVAGSEWVRHLQKSTCP